mgnify:FL=1
MDYDGWIERERRIRNRILDNSPVIKNENKYRVCQDCDEILLCHEEKCPNCDSYNMANKNIYVDIQLLKDEIRCWRRFVNLVKETSKE